MIALEQFLAQCARTTEFCAFSAAHRPDSEVDLKLARLAQGLTSSLGVACAGGLVRRSARASRRQ
jgi:hypothetical protein